MCTHMYLSTIDLETLDYDVTPKQRCVIPFYQPILRKKLGAFHDAKIRLCYAFMTSIHLRY